MSGRHVVHLIFESGNARLRWVKTSFTMTWLLAVLAVLE